MTPIEEIMNMQNYFKKNQLKSIISDHESKNEIITTMLWDGEEWFYETCIFYDNGKSDILERCHINQNHKDMHNKHCNHYMNQNVMKNMRKSKKK